MTDKISFDYETKCKTGLMFIRNQFRNKSNLKWATKFPFDLEEKNDLLSHPYDIYTDPKTNSKIWVMGNDAHCHVGGKQWEYKEGICIHCEPKHKKGLIKKISRVSCF
jgi:hypothetical protein